MEAKDTVMTDIQLVSLQDEGLVYPEDAIILQRDTAEKQADISFKAGYEQAQKECGKCQYHVRKEVGHFCSHLEAWDGSTQYTGPNGSTPHWCPNKPEED